MLCACNMRSAAPYGPCAPGDGTFPIVFGYISYQIRILLYLDVSLVYLECILMPSLRRATGVPNRKTDERIRVRPKDDVIRAPNRFVIVHRYGGSRLPVTGERCSWVSEFFFGTTSRPASSVIVSHR